MKLQRGYMPGGVDARLLEAAHELLENVKRLAGRQDCTCSECIEAFAIIDRIEGTP